jgi:hypothetical protein
MFHYKTWIANKEIEMAKNAKAPRVITTAQLQDLARRAAMAKGPRMKQGAGAHGGTKRDQHRRDRKDAKNNLRGI